MDAFAEESWMPVVSHRGYEVSSLGRIRASNGELLCAHIGKGGYLRVGLQRPRKTRLVHHLVLEAFVGPRPEGAVGLHWNDNGGDNRASNLRWGSHSDNQHDAVRNGTHVQARKTRCVHGHLLAEPNLLLGALGREGRRVCLACNRARHSLSNRGLPFDPALADENYIRIMEGASHG